VLLFAVYRVYAWITHHCFKRNPVFCSVPLARTSNYSLTRGRYNIPNNNCLKENIKEIEKLVAGPRWAPGTKTDWPTDCLSVVMWLWLWLWLVLSLQGLSQSIAINHDPSGIALALPNEELSDNKNKTVGSWRVTFSSHSLRLCDNDSNNG
jgi:hypothetical protein